MNENVKNCETSLNSKIYSFHQIFSPSITAPTDWLHVKFNLRKGFSFDLLGRHFFQLSLKMIYLPTICWGPRPHFCRYAMFQVLYICRLCLNDIFFEMTHQTIFNEVRSGDLIGHSFELLQPIHVFWNIVSTYYLAGTPKW